MYILVEEVVKVLKGRNQGETRLSTFWFTGWCRQRQVDACAKPTMAQFVPLKVSFGVYRNLVCSHIGRQ